MQVPAKKDYIIVATIFLLVLALGFFSSNRHHRLVNEYPAKLAELETDDFLLHYDQADLLVGQASWEEVTRIYPQGKNLGMSSVYRPQGLQATFTFTKNSNILSKVDIADPGIITSRGVAVNDPFTKVVKQYGQGFIRSYLKDDPKIFDAVFGSKHYIVFHVEDNIVKKIVLDYQTVDK